ncbi:recombinase family protein (plasmid) [Clostridium botulinum]|uniref:Resolvase n=1 Tax=Clostridium botulinum C/D str. DC5 TaxID=1443128 RepID=A0A0A0I461_CLOBO|nr:recombinase family protein [Clostridium botulinum]KGM96159.1 resolvase [Clostridium botulinum C/D str. DC5]KOC56627.1 resolvase [Clostridium botulinum]KOC58190.1 resolvase [Clostridium botulinum]MCD3235265.1 recombinase family protein [Clostridium botulinum D/C]MCD3241187.1 recombinase family protein [Clostridium botulinum D/C]
MIYGYARCSTDNIKQDITRQTRELKSLGVEKDNIYFEYASGTKVDREQLTRLMDIVVEGDIIVATEVSRITRSSKQLCEIIEFAKDKKIKLILGNFVVDCTKQLDAMTEGMLKMMGVFAELERNMISQRVRSGMANARSKGKVIGRPQTTIEDIPSNIINAIELLKDKKINKSECARMCNISRPTLDKYIKIIEG